MTSKLLKRRTARKAKPAIGKAKSRAGTPDGHADLRLWLRLLFCASHIESVVQSRIMNEFDISLARFDLMSQLERVGGGLTMSEVSRRMMVSNGATTSLVDKLVEDGLVQREAHPEDRRTTLLHLTEQGRARFLAMAREHEQWIIKLLAGLDASAKQSLLSGLGALKQHLEKLDAEA
ncbi:MarR family winged helix-turn-helix transcriptional regulator [Dongia deserti]|uniref:MarR family winged helix-turn-helix transcriptional regulator n=1 Tax=Dongia deserti TaxID=2268030 RepID=UPI000E650BBD|nr:MarR family transcriptional regulator [Dongia deserti]